MRNDKLSFFIRVFIPTFGLFIIKARPDLTTLAETAPHVFLDQHDQGDRLSRASPPRSRRTDAHPIIFENKRYMMTI
jgi:hypothetical protein